MFECIIITIITIMIIIIIVNLSVNQSVSSQRLEKLTYEITVLQSKAA